MFVNYFYYYYHNNSNNRKFGIQTTYYIGKWPIKIRLSGIKIWILISDNLNFCKGHKAPEHLSSWNSLEIRRYKNISTVCLWNHLEIYLIYQEYQITWKRVTFHFLKQTPWLDKKKGISKFLEGPVQYTLKQKYCNTLWPKCSYYVL